MPIDLNRQAMPAQDAWLRRRNFSEVALGYSPEEAMAEVGRCLQCKNKPCEKGCPVGVDIGGFIKALRDSDMPASARALKSNNNLPAICGRVCPQETQCEEMCVLAKRGAPIAIGRLERYVADWELGRGPAAVEMAVPTGKKVAVVGSGPAGLTCAADLARKGHAVTVFEALHTPGGVLVYGIPEFRLPKRVVEAEVEYVRRLGAEIRCNWMIGNTLNIDELLADGFSAVFVGTGAGLPSFLGVPGENLNGVYSANEFLTRVNLMKAYLFPDQDTPVKKPRVAAVVGAGNVAMDSARCAVRLGAEKAYIVYRRSEAEMPARREEAEHAKEEGIDFRLLTNPTRILDDGKGWVAGMEVLRMDLGEPDASGRRRPVPVPGSEYTIEADTVVVAVGTSPNPVVPRTTPGLETTQHGTVVADPNTGATTRKGVWAGGDIVTGAATVIEAMGAGKRAAAAMHLYLSE